MSDNIGDGTLESTKLELEAQKLREEIRVLRRPPLFHPSAYIPLVAALIGVGGTYQSLSNKLNDADELANSAKRETEALEDALPKSVLENILRIKMRFHGSITRAQISGLQAELTVNEFVASVPFRTTDVQANSIVYYNDSDALLAQDLSNRVYEYFTKLGCPLVIKPTKSSELLPNRAIQLDVYHKCKK